MSEQRPDRCETCRYWDREWYQQMIDEEKGVGFCCRMPPVLCEETRNGNRRPHELQAWQQALSAYYGFCGEWKAKEAPGGVTCRWNDDVASEAN